MPLPKPEKIESSLNPLALIVGESDITIGLSRKLSDNGCEVIELADFPKGGKFNYIFQFANISKVKDSYLKFLKPHGKYLFIDYKNENINQIRDLAEIRILRIDNLNPWYFQKLIDQILAVAFTQSSKNVIDLRLNKKSAASSAEIKKENNNKSKQELPVKVTSGIVQKKLSSPLKFLIITLFLILFSAGLLTYWQGKVLSGNIEKFESHFGSGEYGKLKTDVKNISTALNSLGKITKAINSSSLPLHGIEVINQSDAVIDSAKDLVNSLNFTLGLLTEIAPSNRAIIAKDVSISKLKYEELQNSLVALSERTKNLKKRFESFPVDFSSKNQLSGKLADLSADLDSIVRIMPPFEKIIYGEKKDYLLLFQNNMELRATGGFIGSVGFLALNNGRMDNLEIMDVYAIDGQIKGHVDPPPEFRKHFDQANFFLRDSNFDPDFAASSIQAEWFIDKALGRKVDGVVGINLFLVQDLLEALGPVTLSDFNNEVITSDNLFVKAQVFINQNFFAGSTQKKDFLSSVSTEIQKKLVGPDISYLKLFRLLKKSLEEKNLIFYFNNPDLQQEFENLGFAGRIFNIRCLNVSENCVPDYLAIIESNFGVNKANYFVSKSVKITKKIDANGRIITDLVINYDNQSKEGLLQGGEYKNYLRLLLPKSISFISSSFDSQSLLSTSFDLSSYQNDKVVYGVLLKIPQNSSKVFKFSYTHPESLLGDKDFYQFYIQKQPGDKVSTLELGFESDKIILTPFNFQPKNDLQQQVGDIAGKFLHLSENSVDRIFQFKLGK